jgi:hypothetical protein
VQLSLPLPDETFQQFRIEESPIMEPALAARFPEIKTYKGQGIDDPTAITRFDVTPAGFHGMVLSSEGTVLIEPLAEGDITNYIAYFQKDVAVNSFECAADDSGVTEGEAAKAVSEIRPEVTSGTALRTYRLAVAATGEYTQRYGGGTVTGGLSAVTTTVNLVDAIYERDVAVRLVLIANEDAIIFTDPVLDGYTSDNATALIGENQTKIDSVVGTANYDIGHVFDGRQDQPGFFSFQGVASIGVVCRAGSKARGVSISRSVQPSSVIAYYSTAHEMGHQFSATHTFNGSTGSCSSQRTAATAYEPGTGSTIMGYRFTCGSEDLMSSDTYFHNASLEQIVNYTTTGSGNCATQTSTGNNPPLIPQSTPFKLTAVGSDPDGDQLTYCWEEFDLGAAGPPNSDDGSRPIFRSFAPVPFPSRSFPQLAGLISPWESLPVTTRTMNFRVTLRDNHFGGGAINSAAMQVNVRADSGPFTITQPTSGTIWTAGAAQTVTWDVANTSSAPVSCAAVRILLSTDQGLTFPIVLANNTPNDGSQLVTIPGITTSGARIKVESVGNIFFNVSGQFDINGQFDLSAVITGFTPGNGAVGTNVTITGRNFIGPLAVRFNGTIASFTLNSTTEIVATVPLGATSGPISVFISGRTTTSASNFTVVQPVNSVQFSGANYSVSEDGISATISVTRTGDTSGPARADFATSDLSAQQLTDYTVAAGTLTFAAGETTKAFTVLVCDDFYVEGSEQLSLSLSNVTGATLGTPGSALLTIIDNDSSAPATNPLDTAQFFVRQQYADFLSRVPDQGGFDFWTNQITECGADQACINARRIRVSDAFFFEPEFQQTGAYVFRLYRAAYGNSQPFPNPDVDPNFPGESLKLPSYAVFVRDRAAVVGGADLALAQLALANDFVQRPAFQARYSPSFTGPQFVAILLNNIQVASGASLLSQTQALINLYDQSGPSAVLYRLADDNVSSNPINNRAYIDAEYNRAFVATQYFGYLRRDADIGGFLFWLNQVNRFALRDLAIQHAMACSFITSIEYQQRFSSIVTHTNQECPQ